MFTYLKLNNQYLSIPELVDVFLLSNYFISSKATAPRKWQTFTESERKLENIIEAGDDSKRAGFRVRQMTMLCTGFKY